MQLKHTDVFVDATLGGAGHSLSLLHNFLPDGVLIGIDQDPQALEVAEVRLKETFPNLKLKLFNRNFGELDEILIEAELPGIDAILFDLGGSSYQFDTPERGFKYSIDAPLDMRMNPSKQTITAVEVINHYNATDLTRIFQDYGEEKWASRISDFIVEARSKTTIETSGQLVKLIEAAIPIGARREGGHPAKRVFQALRIEVNAELEVLKAGLDSAIRWLNPGGRIAVISYHSLEDRIVKQNFADNTKGCICPDGIPECVCGRVPILKTITKKPILPSVEEVKENIRAKSAKLRVAEKL
jgi:16S rRNA (cytosine1402-N4)-methyltransferase